MNTSSGIITLDQLLALDLANVRVHLDNLQPPNVNDPDSIATFLRETRGISLITFLVDQFMSQQTMVYNIKAQVHVNYDIECTPLAKLGRNSRNNY